MHRFLAFRVHTQSAEGARFWFMFGKIFTQIFDSSLADNPQTRWIFMDLLVLADQNGVVDMTHEAIARRTNVPLASVETAIQELESKDGRSRSVEFGGVRIKRLDAHRTWGWAIVNYSKYRAIANAEAYREVTRQKVAKMRDEEKAKTPKAASEAQAYSGKELHVITSNNNFKKPQQNELELYASKLGFPLSEIPAFFDHYESNGWRVGKSPMKNWQAAMRNWLKNYRARIYAPNGQPQQRTLEDKLIDEI